MHPVVTKWNLNVAGLAAEHPVLVRPYGDRLYLPSVDWHSYAEAARTHSCLESVCVDLERCIVHLVSYPHLTELVNLLST